MKKKTTFSKLENDLIAISYKPTFHGGEIKITFNKNQIEPMQTMFNFLNQQSKKHLKYHKENLIIDRRKAAIQREKIKDWEETFKNFSFVAHKIRLKHGTSAQRFYLMAVSKYKDKNSINQYIALGKKIYGHKVIEARNKRIIKMVDDGITKKNVAELFGIKPPTLSNILRKNKKDQQLKLNLS